jgi:hypothetical protein
MPHMAVLGQDKAPPRRKFREMSLENVRPKKAALACFLIEETPGFNTKGIGSAQAREHIFLFI